MIYVINVLTGKEKEIAETIERLYGKNIKKVYNPISIFDTPVFPSYIFLEAELTDDLYYKIKSIPGVIYFLDPNSGIMPIEAEEEEVVKKENPKVTLINKPVQVVSGPYKGAKGLIKRINYPYITIKPENFNSLEEVPNLEIHIKHLIMIETTLEPGTKIKIKEGEYKGLEGVIEQILYPDAVVLVNILDNEVLLDIPIAYLERGESNGFQ